MLDRSANYLSIFLVSAGVLTFEVVLTRIFALAFWHHFAGLLISLALIGFGTAGGLMTVFLPGLKGRESEALLATACCSAWLMPLAYILALLVDLKPLTLAWSPGSWFDLGLVCLILVLPFLAGAAHIGLLLSWADNPAGMYAANLAGSAAGCLAAAVLLDYLPPNQALYGAAGLTLLGSCLYLKPVSRRVAIFWWGACLAGFLLLLGNPLPLKFEDFKDRSAALAARGGRLEHRAVGLAGLAEIIGGPAFHYAPGLSLNCDQSLPEQKGLFLDGDLIGPVTRIDPENPMPGFVRCLLFTLPFRVFRPEKVLIINPGGGLGIMAGLEAGAGVVAGVEDNPEILYLMEHELLDFTGHLYHRPAVRVVRADPMVYLLESREQFDLIVLGFGGAWESGSTSGLGVTRLLTVEGLGQMMARLSPRGVLAAAGPLMKPERASVKLLGTAVLALERSGLDPERCLAAARDWNTVQIMIKPGGIDKKEQETIREAAEELGVDLPVPAGARTDRTGRHHLLPQAPLATAAGFFFSGRADEYYSRAWFDLRPATRDRPYFFNFFRPRIIGLVWNHPNGLVLGADEWGLLFTWGGLIASLLLAAAGILLPLLLSPGRPLFPLFFSLIGLGYMAAEITCLSEAVYRLGRPALAVPLVVGTFLLLSGLGSLLWGKHRPQWFTLAAGPILGLTFLGLRLAPGGPLVTGLIMAPAALVMGIPFSAGLRHLAGEQAEHRAWAFGLNGFFSVAGSLGGVILCLEAGHPAAMLTAGSCYLLAGFSISRR